MSKDLEAPRKEEEIRPNDLVRVTEAEAQGNKDRLKNIPVDGRNYKKFRGEGQSTLPKGIIWGVAGLVLLFIAGFVISVYVVRGRVMGSISARIGTLQQGVQDLQNLDPQSASARFSSIDVGSSSDLGSFASALGFLFKGGSDAVTALTDISGKLAALSQEFIGIQNSVFGFLATGQGSDLVSHLTTINTLLAAVDADSNQISAAASKFGSLSPIAGDAYIPLKAEIGGAQKFLDIFIPWLSDPAPHHILLLLQNTSEMRPGGGFLGSYGDVTLAGGNITNIAVHDVADVDLGFKQNIIPPKPLQLEGAKWRPADGNWFFDFPTSASETISLFERSNLYATPSSSSAPITFDGAIAVSPKVISDLLTITGPITIGKPSTTFNSNNLVVQVQKIVQAGQATAATYPKSVLSSLAGALFQKLASSTDDDKQKLLGMALDWIAKKDAMVYFKNRDFENFAGANGATGAVYELPLSFNGDYFAIANADVNSDKSELYVSQDINLIAVVNSDGTETNHLVVTRTHTGNKSPYFWYQTTNTDYLQIFVPPGSSVDNTNGAIAKTVPAPINYINSGYSTDPTILQIESSTRTLFDFPAVSYHPESGKEVFSAWSRVRAGTSAQFSLDYSHRLFAPPAEGGKYQFVFEKQPGASGHYKFEINAPLGFKFVENNLPSYDYESNDPPGRLIINLTLGKI